MPALDRAIIAVLGEHLSVKPEGMHGYDIARMLPGSVDYTRPTDATGLQVNGTVYKALARLRRCGALACEWEDASVALEERRPRRRYHTLTANGRARAEKLAIGRGLRRYLAQATATDPRGRV